MRRIASLVVLLLLAATTAWYGMSRDEGSPMAERDPRPLKQSAPAPAAANDGSASPTGSAPAPADVATTPRDDASADEALTPEQVEKIRESHRNVTAMLYADLESELGIPVEKASNAMR